MALNVKQKYPGTQGGAAQLYASDTRLSLRRREQVFTRLSKSYKENMIFQAPEAPEAPAAPAMKKLHLLCLFLPGSVDATWRISSSSLRMCARQDCFEFYCNFSCSRHMSKSANLIGPIVFDAARQTKKKRTRGVFFKNYDFTRAVFRVGVHTHVGAFVGVKRRRISRANFFPVCTGLNPVVSLVLVSKHCDVCFSARQGAVEVWDRRGQSGQWWLDSFSRGGSLGTGRGLPSAGWAHVWHERSQ